MKPLKIRNPHHLTPYPAGNEFPMLELEARNGGLCSPGVIHDAVYNIFLPVHRVAMPLSDDLQFAIFNAPSDDRTKKQQ
jgi:hypothetical protein